MDTYCLGVKDVFVVDTSLKKLRQRLDIDLERSGAEAIAPSLARRLLEEAVDYSARLGIDPDPDYGRSLELLADVVPQAGPIPPELGQNGKPFYMSHPDDSPSRCRRVVESLLRTCGPGGFDVVVLPHQAEAMADLLSRMEASRGH